MNYDIFTIFSKLRFRKTIKVINIHRPVSVIYFTETSETASHKQDSIRKIIHAKVVNIPCVFETLLRAFHDLFTLISFHFQIWILHRTASKVGCIFPMVISSGIKTTTIGKIDPSLVQK